MTGSVVGCSERLAQTQLSVEEDPEVTSTQTRHTFVAAVTCP